MKIVIAPNSFKHSLGAKDVIRAFQAGLADEWPLLDCVGVPMADGGQGTALALHEASGGRRVCTVVHDPLGRKRRAELTLCAGGLAVLDMASASGLALLSATECNPLHTTSFGTGELIRAAMRREVRRIIVGAGGSATVDGGAGALQALGAKFFSSGGRVITEYMTGGLLDRVAKVDLTDALSATQGVEIIVAVDVRNPLLGRSGAARVFGPQKGASPAAVAVLERNLKHWAALLADASGRNLAGAEGMGAAGGLPLGLAAGARARLEPGGKLVADLIGLEDRIRDADVVVTGEGEVNAQTLFGKAPFVVLKLALEHKKPCFVVCGAVGRGAGRILEQFPNAVLWPIADRPRTLDESLMDARRLIRAAGSRLARTLRLMNCWMGSNRGNSINPGP
ncbi:MAG: glycerate kinase [Candidatus Sumerlaeia bacterium]